jgi:predicted transcriptional regulator of viral defense system
MYLKDYMFQLLSDGKYFFTKREILSKLSINEQQFKYQAYRLAQKKMIRRLVRDFYMIIPAEHSHMGGLPPHWIIDHLMKFLGQDYYIALLSAASIYGSTHQQPMVFQVITTHPSRNIKLERSCIEFHSFKECSLAAREQISSPTGYANISTKEQTMIDLVRFYNACGYLSNCAGVIKDLAQECDDAAFKKVIQKESNNSVLQRLGYILELTEHNKLSILIANELSKRNIQQISLRPDLRDKAGTYNERFKLIINDEVELEE